MRISINTLGSSKIKAGIGNYVYELIHKLAVFDKKNKYYLIVNNDNKQLYQIKQDNFHFITAPFFTTNTILRALWEQTILPILCKLQGIDILHSTGFVAPYFLTCKSIITIHDLTFFTHPEVHERKKIWYFTKLIPLSCQRAAAIIADSESTRKDLIKILKIPPCKINTIHLAGNPSCIPIPKERAKQTLTEKYQITNQFILFVGTIEPRKNLTKLIESYSQSNITADLVIVGKKGWMTTDLYKKIKELNLNNKIHFTGYVPESDLKYFYSTAELFIYPSLYEGFGLPVLEAMQSGCPVITSNTSSTAEIASDAALLIDPKKEFSAAIKTLYNDNKKRTELIKKGFNRAKTFTWESCARKTLQLYQQVYNSSKHIKTHP